MFVNLQMCVKCVQFSSHAAALQLLLCRHSAVQLLRGSCTHVFPLKTKSFKPALGIQNVSCFQINQCDNVCIVGKNQQV